MVFVWIVLALCALYLWLIEPRRRHPDASALVGRLYAHRGLHDGNQSVIENSLAAFQRAVDAGYGIELDVQLTADDRLVVHHDSSTKRVCGKDCVISQTKYDDLPPLPDGSPIPLFSQVLTLVGGKVPLIVEVKPHGRAKQNVQAALAALADYRGAYCMESFHPLVVLYLRRHAPQILRGQLAMGGRFADSDLNPIEFFALKYLLVNVFGRPHFVAYSCATDRNLSMLLMKRLYHPLLAAWTIRDQSALDRARTAYDMPIFERFIPDGK